MFAYFTNYWIKTKASRNGNNYVHRNALPQTICCLCIAAGVYFQYNCIL